MLSSKEQLLLGALEPRAREEGFEIVTVEISGPQRNATIRVYIDCDGGVGLDELMAAQTWIGDIVEAIDPFPGAYNLEVSSPGLDRPLRTAEHFQRFIGQRVKLKTLNPLEGRSSWTGTLKDFKDDDVSIECDGALVKVPLQAIKRANVIADIDFSG